MHHKKRKKKKNPSMLDNDHSPFSVVDKNGWVNITQRGYHFDIGAVMKILAGINIWRSQQMWGTK